MYKIHLTSRMVGGEKYYMQLKLEILQFYDFLVIDQNIIEKLFLDIGGKLEESTHFFVIDGGLLRNIILHFPSLYFDDRYNYIEIPKDIELELNKNKIKYISNWRFEKFYIKKKFLSFPDTRNFEICINLTKMLLSNLYNSYFNSKN